VGRSFDPVCREPVLKYPVPLQDQEGYGLTHWRGSSVPIISEEPSDAQKVSVGPRRVEPRGFLPNGEAVGIEKRIHEIRVVVPEKFSTRKTVGSLGTLGTVWEPREHRETGTHRGIRPIGTVPGSCV
jgi:hypothetical protein